MSGTESWRAGKTTAQRGYGSKWQRYRLAFLKRHPLCAMCAAKGGDEPASVVDHIVPHRGDRALFWDRTNHQSVCKPCHDRDKAAIEHGRKVRPTIGRDGYPIADS